MDTTNNNSSVPVCTSDKKTIVEQHYTEFDKISTKISVYIPSELSKLERHPLSACFPEHSEQEFQALRESLIKNGQQNPIVMHEGKVLDGWNRVQAGIDANKQIEAVEFSEAFPERDPKAFVIAQNATRRHLSKSQLVFSVVRVTHFASRGSNQHNNNDPARKTQAEIAGLTGASKTSIEQAKRIVEKGCDVLQEAVLKGECSLKKAACIISNTSLQEEQIALLKTPLSKLQGEQSDRVKASDVIRRLLEITGKKIEELVPFLQELMASKGILKEGEQNDPTHHVLLTNNHKEVSHAS